MKLIKHLIFLSLILIQSLAVGQEVSQKNLDLMTAAYEGQTDSVIHLIMDTADVNARSEDGITPLMYAAERGHEDIVKILLYNKANPNIVPYSGRTALISAAMQNHPEIVYLLLLYGADINAADENGVTALIYCSGYNLQYMVQYLLENGADPSLRTTDSTDAMLCGVYHGNKEIVDSLLSRNITANTTDKNGFSPVSVAIQNGDAEMLDTLLHHKASANINIKSKPQINAVDYARILNQKKTIKTLRKQGIHGSALPWFNKIILNYNPGVFSTRDFFMGGGLGIFDSKYNMEFDLGFNARIAKKRILEQQSDSVYLQLWEKRRYIYASFEKLFAFPTNNHYERQGIFIRLKGLYSFGSFEGMTQKPKAKLAFVPGIGYTYLYRNFFVKAAYEYASIDNYKSSPHWINVSVGVTINCRKGKLTKKIDWM